MPAPRKDRRPEGWSPEWVLAWLIEHPGVYLRDAISWWADDSCGIRYREHIARDLRLWKRDNPSFSEALGEVRPGTRAGRPAAEDLVAGWQERFLAVYALTHDRKESAERAGVSFQIARRHWQPARPEYNQELHEAMKEIEAESVELARSGVLNGMQVLHDAVAEGDPKAADALLRHSTKILEVREPEEWARQQVTKIGGTVFHLHADARPRVMGNLAEVNRRIGEGAAAALPAHVEGQEILVAEVVLEEAG